MKEVSRKEFEDLVKQVRSLERQVDEQQKQIATLKRRTTTDSGVKSDEESSQETTEVPISRIKLDVMDILRDTSADEEATSVEEVKNEAAKMGHLRSEAKSVLRGWISNGYLTGNLEENVEVVEWPPETKVVEE